MFKHYLHKFQGSDRQGDAVYSDVTTEVSEQLFMLSYPLYIGPHLNSTNKVQVENKQQDTKDFLHPQWNYCR
jgi:hypothetical protein